MKKILLLCSLAISFFAAPAQGIKSHTKKMKTSRINSQAMIQAHLDSLQVQRQSSIDSSVTYQLKYDSLRKENERIADEKFQHDQLIWKENKSKELDSSNKAVWTSLSKNHEQWLTIRNKREEIYKAAKLNDYQDRQVNYINESIFDKAKKINTDSSLNENAKKQQLQKLNEERRSRIRTIVGKSKERKIEKARKEKTNPADTDAQWINEIDGVVKR